MSARALIRSIVSRLRKSSHFICPQDKPQRAPRAASEFGLRNLDCGMPAAAGELRVIVPLPSMGRGGVIQAEDGCGTAWQCAPGSTDLFMSTLPYRVALCKREVFGLRIGTGGWEQGKRGVAGVGAQHSPQRERREGLLPLGGGRKRPGPAAVLVDPRVDLGHQADRFGKGTIDHGRGLVVSAISVHMHSTLGCSVAFSKEEVGRNLKWKGLKGRRLELSFTAVGGFAWTS